MTGKFYVQKKGETVGEAVVMTSVIYVHFYDSRGSFQYSSVEEMKRKGFKLIPQQTTL